MNDNPTYTYLKISDKNNLIVIARVERKINSRRFVT